MAYQGIQMPGFEVPDFASTLLAARNLERQKEADRWAQLRDQGIADRQNRELALNTQIHADAAAHQAQEDARQRQADQDAIIKEVNRLHQAGLGHQAEQFARMHGLTPTEQPNGPAPVAPQLPTEPTAPVEPEQGPILPGAGDEHSKQMQAERDAVAAFPAQMDEYGRQMTEVFPQQQAQYEKDQAAYEQRQANPIVSYQASNGQTYTVDPMEARRAQQAENERRAAEFRQAFANEPGMIPYAGEFGARAALGEPQQQIFGDLRARQVADAKAKAEADKLSYEHEHKGEISPAALEQQKALARIRAQASVSAQAPKTADEANRKDMAALRQEETAWRNANQLAVDAKSAKRLATVMHNINSGNAMQQREAAESMVSIFKGGGQVTKASQDLLLKHLAGIVGDAQTWLQHLESGHFGARELQVLQQAAQSAIAEEQDRAQSYYQSYVDKFGPGTGWENLAGNVNHNAKSYFRQYGLDVPDVYEGAPGSVVLGSGKRHGAPAKATSGGATTKVTMPDGSVQEFDASGKRVK